MFRGTLLALGLFLTSCGSPGGAVCVDDGDCTGVAVCTLEGRCLEVECTSSEQCALGSTCDEATNACVAGCSTNQDCLAGEECNAGTCAPYGCRSTELDCAYGETCNPQTGQCDFTTQPHCAPANTAAEQNGCVFSLGGSVFCWEEDAMGNLSDCYCMLPCNGQDPNACPRGLECLDAGTGSICYGDCPFLLENL